MFKKIRSNFFVNFDIKKIENLPEILHKYGNTYPISDDIHWMTYDKGDLVDKLPDGSISFSSHTFKFLPEFTDEVIEKLKENFGNKIPWYRERVRIIRTNGTIVPHVDEVRNTCINIGLLNSNTAITHFSISNSYSDFDSIPPNTASYICNDGEAYLLDVKRIHAVYPISEIKNDYRYLITYGFKESFQTILDNVSI